MAYRLLPAYQARIARRGIPANSNLSFPSGKATLHPPLGKQGGKAF